MLAYQRARHPLHQDIAVVYHHQPIAQMLRLVHIMRGQQNGNALPFQHHKLFPHQQPRLRIKPRGRLVKHKYARLMQHRPRYQQPPPHPARKLIHRVMRLVLQLKQRQRLMRPLPYLRARHIEIPPVCVQVLKHAQIRVKAIRLRHYPQRKLYRPLFPPHILPVHHKLPPARRRYARQHLHRGSLARPVRPQKPKALPLPYIEAYAVHRREIAVLLCQIVRVNSRPCANPRAILRIC